MENFPNPRKVTEEEARKQIGDELIDKVLSENCDFTNRDYTIYDKTEMSASIKTDKYIVTVYYLLDTNDVNKNHDDLSKCDYSNYTFEIEELWC